MVRCTRRLSFRLIHSRSQRFTGDRGPPVRAGQERLRTVVNGVAQSSKACDKAAIKPPAPERPPIMVCGNSFPLVRRVHSNGLRSRYSCSLLAKSTGSEPPAKTCETGDASKRPSAKPRTLAPADDRRQAQIGLCFPETVLRKHAQVNAILRARSARKNWR